MSQTFLTRAANSGTDALDTGTTSNAYISCAHRTARKKFRQNWLCLYDCLSTFNALEATDPREKIYALLGIVDTFPKLSLGLPPLEPSYSRPVTDLYTYVTRALLDDSQKYLGLLTTQNSDPQAIPRLPS
jgi:hypothetical protein